MAEINKRRCGAFGGEVQKASTLSVENTQEYRDVIGMGRFKLSASIHRLEEPFNQLSNSIQDLWLSEGEQVPQFVNNFVDYWSVGNYSAFCDQLKLWALDHGKAPFEELRRRVQELILCNKKSFQLLTIRKLLDKSKNNEGALFEEQANIQQLCNEIGEKDDRLFVDSNNFEHSNTQFERLKSLVHAMRQHSNYLANQRLTRRRLVNVSISEQAKIISEPIHVNKKRVQPQINKTKSNDDELER